MKEKATIKEIIGIIADIFGEPIGETAIRKHIAKSQIKPTSRGIYPVAPILESIKEGRSNHYSPVKDSAVTDMKQKKLQLECELLQAKIDEVRKVTMPVSECRDLLVNHMNLVKKSIEHFPKDVSALIGDLAAIKALEDKCKAVLDQLSEECGQYDRSR